jgi:hypothetical protein
MAYQVSVHQHPVRMGANPTQASKWKAFIESNLAGLFTDSDLQEVDVYNMQGRFQNLLSQSDGKRFIILGNASHKNGEEQQINDGYLQPSNLGVIIEHPDDNNSTPVAEYIQNSNELNILFDIFAEYNETRTAIFMEIMNKVNEAVFKQKAARYSWKYTADKAGLMRNLVSDLRTSKERTLAQDKAKCRELENRINDIRAELKQIFDRLTAKRNAIEVDEATLGSIEKNVAGDLDALVANPKVTDVQIKDGKYTVHTCPIYAYDEKNRRYYIGNCWLDINMNNAEVKFYSDNPRRGFWGMDYHPHVSNNGNACLGNASATIAELCSQQQLYALVMVCIDYLESVNIQDAAGRRVTAWDKVNENGKIIAKGGTYKLNDDVLTCSNCDEEVSVLHTCYENVHINADEHGNLTYEPVNERQLCSNCLDDDYHLHEESGFYIYD